LVRGEADPPTQYLLKIGVLQCIAESQTPGIYHTRAITAALADWAWDYLRQHPEEFGLPKGAVAALDAHAKEAP
jgi:hypothetical protein